MADVCAGAGRQNPDAAQMMENRGEILAGDLYPAKCDAMAKRAAAMGVSILRTAARDASAPCPEPLRGAFDRVICDAPCSGLGVIRRKPEIRYKEPGELRRAAGDAVRHPLRGGADGEGRGRSAIFHLHPEPGGERGGFRPFPCGNIRSFLPALCRFLFPCGTFPCGTVRPPMN